MTTNTINTIETATNTINMNEVVDVINRFSKVGVEVKPSGLNFINKFTIITSNRIAMEEWHQMSVHIPMDRLREAYDEAIEHFGYELIKHIVNMTEIAGGFALDNDLNEEIPIDEVSKRAHRLVDTLTKLGWNPRMYSWEYKQWLDKFPKNYISCVIRAILEGHTGTLHCLSCKHVNYMEGGLMRCDKTTQRMPVNGDVPQRANKASRTEVSTFGNLYTDIIVDPSEKCYMHERITKSEAMKKADNKQK